MAWFAVVGLAGPLMSYSIDGLNAAMMFGFGIPILEVIGLLNLGLPSIYLIGFSFGPLNVDIGLRGP